MSTAPLPLHSFPSAIGVSRITSHTSPRPLSIGLLYCSLACKHSITPKGEPPYQGNLTAAKEDQRETMISPNFVHGGKRVKYFRLTLNLKVRRGNSLGQEKKAIKSSKQENSEEWRKGKYNMIFLLPSYKHKAGHLVSILKVSNA